MVVPLLVSAGGGDLQQVLVPRRSRLLLHLVLLGRQLKTQDRGDVIKTLAGSSSYHRRYVSG